MNVVHVVESLDVGGLERVVVSLASWQKARGDSSRIICLFHEGALAVEARAKGLRVDVMNKSTGLDLRALRALRAALTDSGADVVHTHNAMAHYYAVAAAIGLGIARIVNTRHGMGSTRESRRLGLLYRWALFGTAQVVAVCHAARDGFVSTGQVPAEKALVVPNGVAIENIEPRSEWAKAQLLARLGRPEGTFLIGSVGRLNAVKDHATLLQAVRRMRHSGRAVDLLMIGDGELRAALEAEATELQLNHCVHFVGMRDDVAQWLAALDVFVLSSLSEGYSLALVEAATAALPIVATRVGGNAEIVEHEVTGLLVPARDADAIAVAVARLVDEPEQCERMGQAGRHWALRHGSVQAMGQAYQSLYGGAKGHDRRRPPIAGESTVAGGDR